MNFSQKTFHEFFMNKSQNWKENKSFSGENEKKMPKSLIS